LELLVSPVAGQGSEDHPPRTLRKRLVDVARTAGVDVAVERAGARQRSKRLIVLNVDSTLVPSS
jgi:phosphoserine phosphatase